MPGIGEPRLLIIGTAPFTECDDGLYIDVKFVEGMRLHQAMWVGHVTCILRRSHEPVPFGAKYRHSELGFDLRLIDADATISADVLDGCDVAFCSADAHDMLEIAALGRKLGVKVVYTIECTLKARLQITGLDRSSGLLRRAYTAWWHVRQEIRRCRALHEAAAIQANGYPAASAYSHLNAKTLLYLDNRMGPNMFAHEADMLERKHRLLSGAPLRLVHSGRLEPLKGAQDLVPLALALRAGGMDFTLDIFGEGSLRSEIENSIRSNGLDCVKLHPPMDFKTELVPWNRRNADIFISCHQQSDPSCTYLESMGCGLPVAGYANDMWSALLARSGGGWAVPRRQPKRLAELLLSLCQRRPEITERADAALSFARRHDFPTEFGLRMRHLRGVLA